MYLRSNHNKTIKAVNTPDIREKLKNREKNYMIKGRKHYKERSGM